jgi:pyruvate dehydrogenase E2 component (dihydrolipoamide acetyltransferase)
MAISVVMPALEMAQETGKFVAWRKQEGEKVAKGEILMEVETDKAVMEIESPGDGILAAVSVSVGEVVPVGKIIAWLVAPGEAVPQDLAPTASARRMSTEPTQSAAVAGSAEPAPDAGRLRIAPKARRLASEYGVDVSKVRGTGPQGAIHAADIMAYLEAAKSSSSPVAALPVADSPAAGTCELETPSAIGRIMAERTAASWTTAPHIFLTREIDATLLNAARQKHVPLIERERGVRPTHTDILVAITARVLLKHPRLNASWDSGKIRYHKHVNMSIAVAVEDGVVATVIPNAHIAKLGDIAVQRKELTERARTGRLRPSDIANGTFTISNAGMYNIDHFTAIVSLPQSAILAVGRIADRVVPVCGMIAIRPMLTVTVSVDHRVSSGSHAALFLNDLAEALQSPDTWLD